PALDPGEGSARGAGGSLLPEEGLREVERRARGRRPSDLRQPEKCRVRDDEAPRLAGDGAARARGLALRDRRGVSDAGLAGRDARSAAVARVPGQPQLAQVLLLRRGARVHRGVAGGAAPAPGRDPPGGWAGGRPPPPPTARRG